MTALAAQSLIAFGVRFTVRAGSDGLLRAAIDRAPLSSDPCDHSADSADFTITQQTEREFRVTSPDHTTAFTTRAEALDQLGREVMIHVADHVPEHVFVHAGVVAWKGTILMFPGRSFAGKTTLVAALVQAGATYFSDEYAIFDNSGAVWPYARDLQMRKPGSREQVPTPVEHFGGVGATECLRVSRIIFTTYEPGSTWNPQPVSPARAVLEMMPHTMSARRSYARVMQVLSAVSQSAELLSSPRDDAYALAKILLT